MSKKIVLFSHCMLISWSVEDITSATTISFLWTNVLKPYNRQII